jgi:hypothetical protein
LEWDALMTYDITAMRAHTKNADYQLALLVKHNDEITPEELTRRLKSLPRPAVLRAHRVMKSERLQRTNWNTPLSFGRGSIHRSSALQLGRPAHQ